MTPGLPEPAGADRGPAWRLLLRYAASDGVPARSLRVAAVVGTALNLINQGVAIFGDEPVDWTKLSLTYAVPYAVSTYGAVAFRWGQRCRADGAGPPRGG